MEAIETILTRHKTGRNDDCPCGSGKKYKKCHLLADDAAVSAHLKAQAEARAKEAAAADPEDHSGHEHGPNGEHLYDKPTRAAQHGGGPAGAPKIPIVSKPVTTPRKAS